jgi:hypothetical protein
MPGWRTSGSERRKFPAEHGSKNCGLKNRARNGGVKSWGVKNSQRIGPPAAEARQDTPGG